MEQRSCYKFDAPRKNIDVVDHISQLPDAILSHILTFLNVKEAFRTRLLSHRWRYLCVHMSNLVFDSTFITGLDDEQYFHSSELLPFKHKFVERVDQFLKMITIQKPLTLEVAFPLGQEFASHIDEWIGFATRMECVQMEFYFDLAISAVYGNNSGPYNFPCHLLLSGEKSQLKYLSLYKCIFHPPLEVANRLDSLKSLTLDKVLVEATDLENILCGCLKLEILQLINCEVLSALRICNQDLGLKCLIVKSITFVAKIELSVPNLEMFEFKGWVQDFTFSRLHQLKNVDLNVYGNYNRGLSRSLDELAENAPRLQTLSLTWRFNKYLSYAHINSHTPMLSNLAVLEVTITGDCGWNLFTYMLHKSPQLEVLVIDKGYTPLIDGEPSWTYPQHVPTCLLSSLKEVSFEQFNGQDCELEFAGYILKNASVLEDMTITITNSSIEATDHIVDKIQTFPRSSETCQVFLHGLNFADHYAVRDYQIRRDWIHLPFYLC